MKTQPDYDPKYCPECGWRLALAYVAIKESDDGEDWWEAITERVDGKPVDQHIRLRGADTVRTIDDGEVPVNGAAVFVHIGADRAAVERVSGEVGYVEPKTPNGFEGAVSPGNP